MEDVVGWALAKGDKPAVSVQAEYPDAPGTVGDIVKWLKTETKDKGAKTDLVVHEAIIAALLGCTASRLALRSLLNSFVQIANGETPSMAKKDDARSLPSCAVWRLSLEP